MLSEIINELRLQILMSLFCSSWTALISFRRERGLIVKANRQAFGNLRPRQNLMHFCVQAEAGRHQLEISLFSSTGINSTYPRISFAGVSLLLRATMPILGRISVPHSAVLG